MISVGSLPSTYTSSFLGARALPSLSGRGAYLQRDNYFYELKCTTSSCSWNVMDQQLSTSVTTAVMMYLPAEYTCKSCTADEAETTPGTCTACPDGEIVDSADKTKCNACPTDQAETSSGTCTACPDGEIVDNTDKTKCKPCAVNEAETTPGTCSLCPGGQNSHVTDKTKCHTGKVFSFT